MVHVSWCSCIAMQGECIQTDLHTCRVHGYDDCCVYKCNCTCPSPNITAH